MATLTHAELEALWVAHGGTQATADTAAAIAQAESQGCQYALAGPVDVRPVTQCTYRHTTTENSFGLWQINLMAHPGLAGTDLFNPDNNALAAVSISGAGASFQAWSTYTDGSYRAYLQEAGPNAPPAGIGGTLSPPPASQHTPARWTPPGTAGPVDATGQPAGQAVALTSLAGFGAALGYWLPLGIRQGRANARQLAKIVR